MIINDIFFWKNKKLHTSSLRDHARERKKKRGYIDRVRTLVATKMFRRQCFQQLKRFAARCEGDLPRRSGKCLNSVQLIGYSGSDPLQGSNEFQPTKFSLATTVYYKSRDEKLESRTEWHNISVFKPSLQEKVNAYIRKGTRLFVQGSIQYSNYVDQEGVKRYNTSIVPNDIIVLSQPVSMDEAGY